MQCTVAAFIQTDVNAAVFFERSCAAHDLHLIAFEQGFGAAAQLFHNSQLAGVKLCPIQAVLAAEADFSKFFLTCTIESGRVQQSFGRDAASIEAGASDIAAFDHRRL